MNRATPIADPTAPLARRNPVAKLAAAGVLALALVISLDPVGPAVALAAELAAVPFFGLRYRALGRRTWPLLVGVAGMLFSLVLFAADREHIVASALALALRLLAVALPGVIVFATTDPTDLADALVQNARVSPRFAIGTLAAWRLVPLMGEEWRLIGQARRARGIDPGRDPLARLRLLASASFTLLVGAIRRGTRLATAMDARGFDSGVPRTTARVQRFGAADTALVAGAAVLAAAALTLSVLTGYFNPLFS
ncbi:energy-coupling factor transporter transmembrane component T [Streptomyces sp. SL13]|uniref:Energy-coupling factor transporter transmembrane component T n=1 Tax=Streptantibioticus silvisoli TaxID=2705255 RepID=A0AA90H6Q3_9ACTN|nr:energy-coupling factor transporter transmembrane component T [Streptantibioticus silvisoli]MDI5965280.1 energy-coupling factor transporter transmembrane component T [Streptantibioticus silvisoli]MDI5972936.1 energy-coupling factor transporter transmembrane component T [Streptantibioticus silvisoli]